MENAKTMYAVLVEGENYCNEVIFHRRNDLHLIDENYIKIDKPDKKYEMRIYDRENNRWTDDYYVLPEPEPTYEERMESKADYIMMMQG